jgi:glutamine amidotransferase
MCELLGLSFNKPVNASISFRVFRRRSSNNPDGWGLAYYSENSAVIIKEPIKANKSQVAENIISSKNLTSKIFTSHIRYSSCGEICFKNTHPFIQKVGNKDYVFAHNGTLYGYKSLLLENYFPEGETDSEYIFCYILDKIKQMNISEWTKPNFVWLEKLFCEINNYGNFNCLMSDGEYLFCYFDKNKYNGLHYLNRKAPFEFIRLYDEDMEINLAEEKSVDQYGYIIATSELTDENWKLFKPVSLMVFKAGEIVFG